MVESLHAPRLGEEAPAPAPCAWAALPWRRRISWVVAWACLIASVYLASIRTPFDFIDDGNLVYPTAATSWGQRVQLAWAKVVANYEDLGPFRPVLWAHWELQAELLGADAFRWRLVRLLWAALATGMLLWFLRELRIAPGAAAVTAAVAMWNPYRGEIWRSLTLAEGVAMPYALVALVCAIRAGRSARPGGWDAASALGALAALGCKNTFAALVPAQLLLRIAPEGQGLREGWRRHGRRASLLALTLLFPLIHFLVFKLNWHPGQYETPGPSWSQLGRMLKAVKGAIGLDFVGPGLALAVAVLVVNGLPAAWVRTSHGASGVLLAVRHGFRTLWDQYRAPCRAGLALLVFGIGIYLPLDAVSGRYSIPAVWGADLWIAVLVSGLGRVRVVPWRRLAYAALCGGLVAVALANLGKQAKFAARADVLWQAAEFLERWAPPGATIGWIASPDLSSAEAVHFRWHVRARGRKDLAFRLYDSEGRPQSRRELPQAHGSPAALLTGERGPPPGEGWRRLRGFEVSYWAGTRRYRCSLWTKDRPGGAPFAPQGYGRPRALEGAAGGWI